MCALGIVMPSRRNPSAIDAVPQHVLTAHMVPHLSNADAARWAQVSRAARQNTRQAMQNRRAARVREVSDVARAVLFGMKRAWGNAWGTEIFKEIVDRLPRGQFTVRNSKIRRRHVKGLDAASYNPTIYTPHFVVDIRFSQHVLPAGAWGPPALDDQKLHITIKLRTNRQVQLRLTKRDLTPATVQSRRFPPEWAKPITNLLRTAP